MKRRNLVSRMLAMALALVLLLGVSPLAYASPYGGERLLGLQQVDGVSAGAMMETPALGEQGGSDEYADTDLVRVSIVLKEEPALKCFSTVKIGTNVEAQAYRQTLKERQAAVTSAIERQALQGRKLDVVWNMTLAANLISANVAYGSIDAIGQVAGVREVVIEQRYDPLTTGQAAEPCQSIASGMVGAGTAWASGYTGAGTRVAIIDTGLDTDHQSFDSDAFLYALAQNAADKGMDADAYIESLDLLDKEEIQAVLTDLNIYPYVEHQMDTAKGRWYLNEKVPFALNYVDRNYKVTHDYDGQGGHGSHVAGIAAANRFIPNAAGGYDNAIEAVFTQGMAPDAQVIVMKVFGEKGGAYESDYMVAIEDAIMLGCDVVNLSLGSNKGFTRSKLYQDILDSLEKTDTVVAIAAGNSGHWADYSANGVGHLYAEDVDVSVIGSPSTVANSLSVAAVENNGVTDYYVSVGENILYYTPGVQNSAYMPGLNILGGGDYTYVFTAGLGTAEDVAAAAALVSDPAKAIFVCSRGEIAFSEKATNAANAGFAACIVYNNVDGVMSMNLNDYTGTAPCVSITMQDAEVLKNAAHENGIGTIFVSDRVRPNVGDGTVELSSYSSWGVPGSLLLKPEIAAPGGNIYSVDGEIASGTSMASPQIAGMAAVVMQYIRENGLAEKTGLSPRQLATALLMATSVPVIDENSGNPYPVMQQGSGLVNVSAALDAEAYIKMDAAATSGAADGKVKAELGDDPMRLGTYTFGFTIHNFSENANTYCLKSDFFTQGVFEQDGVKFLDKETVDLDCSVAYTVDAAQLAVSASYACDLNGDGLTNEADARIILRYAAKELGEIDEMADLDENGTVNSYDAHLLLGSMESDYFTVQPGGEVHVQATVTLNDLLYLDENYVNGAYVEGFVTVHSAPDAEGSFDPDYSIPVLGFYGNWSDASMYDRTNYEEYLYNDYIYPYTGGLNYLSVFYDELNDYYFAGNPYLVEERYPAGKEALNSKTELGDMAVTLIRGAGGFMFYVIDGEGNYHVARGADQLYPASYYEAYATWVNINNVGLSIWQTPEQMGFAEGDKMTVGFMSVPEYYETDGALSVEEMQALKASGKIGPGAYHEYTFVIDDTAPEVLSVTKDDLTGNLTVRAKDGNHIAALAVLDAKGSNIMAMVSPAGAGAGETSETVIDMSKIGHMINKDCLIMAADYAGNEVYYKVTGYNEGWSGFDGRMYAFADTATRSETDSWLEIYKDVLFYETSDEGEVKMGGTTEVANMPFTVTAAEYVGGYVFMIADDGYMYVAEQGDWENCWPVGKQRAYSSVRDLAYNYADGKLYALVSGNAIYSVDMGTGEMTKEYTVSLSFPRNVSDANRNLLAMTIDDEGSFYAVNNGDANYKRVFLFKWSDADKGTDGNIVDLTPVNNTETGYAGDYVYNDDTDYMGRTNAQSMAWDHDNDILYWAAGLAPVSPYNILYTFDTATGKASNATAPMDGVEDFALGVLSGNVSGLYIVPTEDIDLPTAEKATDMEIDREEANLFVGAELKLHCSVYPWNLADQSVTWTSSNENVASVDENGVITAHSVGEALITATANAGDGLKRSCAVTVHEVVTSQLKALAYDADGTPMWIDFDLLNPERWTVQPGGEKSDYRFIAGTLLKNTLYYHDGNHMYAVNANTFEVTDCGYVDLTWQWSDAAEAPRNSGGYFDRIVGIINGGMELGVMDIHTGMGFDLSHMSVFKKDRMAVIAYKDSVTFTDEYGTYPAYEYYILTETGELWVSTVFGFDEESGIIFYDDHLEHIGSTGLRLRGVSDVKSGCFGSMIYDEANDQLIVSYCNGSENKMYVFDPDICAPVELAGSFGEDVWPVTALYRYETYESLTVTVEPEQEAIYQGDKLQLSARVYLYESDDSVTWSSSDESIATVDENGLVTAVAPGTVTITATSVEGDAAASSTITVMELGTMDALFHGYRTTENGGEWIAIDGNDLSVTVLGTSNAAYTGAGVADGKVYATDHTHYYEIDAANGYTVTTGDDFTDGDGAECLYMLDGSSAPISSVTLPDLATGEDVTVQMGGKSVYLSGYDGNGYHYLTILDSYETGEYVVAPIDYTYNPAAVAYRASERIEDYWFEFYMVLGYDGLLETYSLYTSVANGKIHTAGGFESDSVSTGLKFEDGDDVSMVWISNDAFTGAVISHAGEYGVELWSFDWYSGELQKLGTIEGTDLVGLSLLSDVGVELPDGGEPAEPVTGSSDLFGYVKSGDSFVWAKINAADGSYETLAQGTMAFNGAGVSEGKVYATYAASAWGAKDFYMVDPAADFAATKGYSGYGVYHMYDGAGAPAMDVELTGGTFTAGGYLAYISWQYSNYYVFLLDDYTAATGYTQPSIEPKLPAKPLGIAYRSTGVSADGSKCEEKFVILCANGALVELTVESGASGFGAYARTETLATLTIDGLSSAGNVSMTKSGEDVFTISVPGVEGVQLYTYDLTSDTLATGPVIDADSLIGLSLYEDVAPTAETVNRVSGSLMSLSLNETHEELVVNTYRLELTEKTTSTNGVIEVTFDAEKLRYTGFCAGDALLAVNETMAQEGKLIVAYAAAADIAAGDVLASLRFDAKKVYVETEITVTTTERNRRSELNEETVISLVLGEKKLPFVDVSGEQWFFDAVWYVYSEGLMNGMTETIFAPGGIVNRGQLVTILYRLAGEPETVFTGKFTDVIEEQWFAKSVEWAAANGIVNGYDNGCFGPNDSVTREQLVTILYRFATWRGDDTSARADLSAFVDADTISVWAKDAFAWAVAEGIVNGMTADRLGPTGTTNRAQVAVILQRFCE